MMPRRPSRNCRRSVEVDASDKLNGVRETLAHASDALDEECDDQEDGRPLIAIDKPATEPSARRCDGANNLTRSV